MSEKFFCAVTIAFCTIGCKQQNKSIPISIPIFYTINGSKVDFTAGVEGFHSKSTDVLASKGLHRKIQYHGYLALKKNTDTLSEAISRVDAVGEIEKLIWRD